MQGSVTNIIKRNQVFLKSNWDSFLYSRIPHDFFLKSNSGSTSQRPNSIEWSYLVVNKIYSSYICGFSPQ